MGSDYMSVQQLLNNSAFQLCLFTEPPYLTSNRHQIRLKGAGTSNQALRRARPCNTAVQQ